MYLIIRMKSKQRLAELENLAETDPEAAAHQIEMLHRNILSLCFVYDITLHLQPSLHAIV